MEFEIAAWDERGEGLVDYLLRVSEAGEESTAMYIVKFLRKDPFVFCIVYFESEVWRNAAGFEWNVCEKIYMKYALCRLNWTKVCAEYLSRGEQICCSMSGQDVNGAEGFTKFNGPIAST